MPRYVDLDEFAKTIKKYIKPKTSEEKDLLEWCTDECIRLGYTRMAIDVQEVRYGEWIEGDYGVCHCSECGFEYNSQAEVTPYCPQCGANMDGEEKSDAEIH